MLPPLPMPAGRRVEATLPPTAKSGMTLRAYAITNMIWRGLMKKTSPLSVVTSPTRCLSTPSWSFSVLSL